MNATIRTAIFGLGLSAAMRAQGPQPPQTVPLPAGAQTWTMIFEDTFEDSSYNTANWNPWADWGGNGSFNAGREKYYASQVRLADGICNLVAEPDTTVTTFEGSYRSGELISARASPVAGGPYKVSFLYGYVEARIKIVNVSGFFGAFWMLPCKENYVYEWEIDILEVLGHDNRTMFQTYHYRPGLALDSSRNSSWTPNRGTGNNGLAPVIDYSTDYHTFGVDWQPDRLAFYIDGVMSGEFTNTGVDNVNIPRTPGYILIQHMVENSWIRATARLLPNPKTSVDTFHVDYVRVWQGAPSSAVRPGAVPGNVAKNALRVTAQKKAVLFVVDKGDKGGTVTVTDARGARVFESVVRSGDSVVWNTSRVSRGVYAVTIRGRGGERWAGKLLVQ